MGWLGAWREEEASKLLLPSESDLDLRDAQIRVLGGGRLSTYAELLGTRPCLPIAELYLA